MVNDFASKAGEQCRLAGTNFRHGPQDVAQKLNSRLPRKSESLSVRSVQIDARDLRAAGFPKPRSLSSVSCFRMPD